MNKSLLVVDPLTLALIFVSLGLLMVVIFWFRIKENRRKPELKFEKEPETAYALELNPEEQLLEELKRQTTAVYLLREEVNSVARKGKRTWYVVVLDVFLSIAVAITFSVALVAFEHSNSLSKSQEQTCISSNQSRISNKALWKFVLGEFKSVTPSSDIEGTQKLNEIQRQVDIAFKLRDCNHNGKTKDDLSLKGE